MANSKDKAGAALTREGDKLEEDLIRVSKAKSGSRRPTGWGGRW